MDKWLSYQRQLPYSDPARYAIIESWARSEAAGLKRDAPPKFRRFACSQSSRDYRSTPERVSTPRPADHWPRVL